VKAPTAGIASTDRKQQGEIWLCSNLFEEISCLELLSSFCDDSSLTYHSAVMVTTVTHTSEPCRHLLAQDN